MTQFDTTLAAYTEAYRNQHGLVPIDAEDETRMISLAQRAIAAGAVIPRQKDKALEPMIDFKALDMVSRRWR
jgi:hypothetical protein